MRHRGGDWEHRIRVSEQTAKFSTPHPGIKRFVNPHRYPVGLEQQLFDLKARLILGTRGVP